MGSIKINCDFKPGKKGLKKVLGDSEVDIMELVWKLGQVKVRDIYLILNQERNVAYTTVMTQMQRLSEKGLLGYVKSGKSYLYYAQISREELVQKIVSDVIESLCEEFKDEVCNYLQNNFGKKPPIKG